MPDIVAALCALIWTLFLAILLETYERRQNRLALGLYVGLGMATVVFVYWLEGLLSASLVAAVYGCMGGLSMLIAKRKRQNR